MSWTDPLKLYNPTKHFLLKVALVMVSLHNNNSNDDKEESSFPGLIS